MTNAKTTKRALLASVISLLLCMSMLIGSTFAWFTDTDVVTASNIVSGTLDIEIVDENGNEKTDALKFLDVNGNADILWEPGVTFRTERFAIKNFGNLNLKFKLEINNTEVSYNLLNEVIDFYLVDAATGNKVDMETMKDVQLAPNAMSPTYYIEAHMDENAGNKYQGKTLDGVSITVYAAQVEAEFDSNDDQYDNGAIYDDELIVVNSANDFVKAFSTMKNGDIIVLNQDIDMTDIAWTPVANKGFTLNGNGHTVTGLNGALVATTAALEYTIKDVTFESLTINATYGANAEIGFGGAAGLIAYADTCSYINMENVTINNATIGGAEYVGGFAGYTSGYGNDSDGPVNASHNFTNCTITNSTLTSNTDGSVGGLIGHAGSNISTTTRVNNFTYSNLVMAQTTETRHDKTGNMIGTANVGVVYITDADIIVEADIGRFVPQGTGRLVINGIEQDAFSNTTAYTTVPKTDTPIAKDDVKNLMGTEGILDFNGAEAEYVYGGAFNASVVKNLQSNGFYTTAITQDTVFENCTFTGDPYAFQVDNGNGYTITFKNCTFVGWVSFATTVTNVSFENCTFDKSSYGVVRFYQDASFTNCTFTENFEWTDTCVNNITVTVTNCTGLTTDKIFYNEGTTGHWIIDGTEVTGVTTH